MVIAVNTRLLIKGKLEGIGWFTCETLKRITQNHKEHKFVFIFDRKPDQEFIFSDNISPVVIPPQTRHPLLWKIWFDYSLPIVFKKHKPDLFLSPDGYLSLRTKVKSLPVIHDINFVHYPQDLPASTSNYYNKYFPKFAAKATRIATVSEYSKQDISKSFSIPLDKIDVVYNGCNEMYKPLSAEEIEAVRNARTNGEQYFVFVGALHPRKNVSRLLQAYDAFREETNCGVKMVIVGEKMFKTTDINSVYNSMKFRNDVIFTGRLSPADLRQVVGSALALTFVPYFEGFGIPIIEAMNCDVPVITSNVTSMPEVAGDAALLTDPFSVDSIRDAMIKMYKDEKLRKTLIEKSIVQRQKFSWDKSAENLWNSVEKTLGQ
ncbi:MAG: glycosyltransferase [Bacteroidetes bacterium GWF2_38_335]|nr:MAG: glycosyltransferase [Bacteroidetes bacterium GWF2_38_335]OFY81178.1 MAG: glycosyltransferase [Bacteroidetes bacterium RIFOXYA12_FULL_38_20]HBS85291.1 glycosyltransferase family 1 protein [Bacteroidales bacterium]